METGFGTVSCAEQMITNCFPSILPSCLHPVNTLVAGVIRVPGQNGKGAVDLLGHHGAGQFMRQSHSAQREGAVGASECCGRPSVGRADAKDDPWDGLVAKTSKQGSELLRSEGIAARIE